MLQGTGLEKFLDMTTKALTKGKTEKWGYIQQRINTMHKEFETQ